MPAKASNRTVPKQTALVKTIGKGYTLTAAKPSGAYEKLAMKDGRTLVWLIPRATYLRMHFIASTEGAPKALLKDTWAAGTSTQLKVTSDNVAQARQLVEWVEKHLPPKPVKAAPAKKIAPKKKTTTAKKTATAKKRVSFRLPNANVRTERIAESEVKSFVASLKEQGATEVSVS
jgi:cell division septation protein DedD